MEFYIRFTATGIANDSFNSQRDGILQKQEQCNKYIQEKFQFPTGWNSTHYLSSLLKRIRQFQFPTGWNSTPSRTLESLINVSFNSQRDGILLCKCKASLRSLRVSIPNGMEFYPIYPTSIICTPEFQFPTGWNSTLLKQSWFLPSHWFQFPTGWNSTKLLAGRLSAESRVSIPNGMEFYKLLTLESLPL